MLTVAMELKDMTVVTVMQTLRQLPLFVRVCVLKQTEGGG